MDKAYSTEIENLEDLNRYLGKEIGISEWFEMSQEKVNSFAELTQDKQWIHIDQENRTKNDQDKNIVNYQVFDGRLTILRDCSHYIREARPNNHISWKVELC